MKPRPKKDWDEMIAEVKAHEDRKVRKANGFRSGVKSCANCIHFEGTSGYHKGKCGIMDIQSDHEGNMSTWFGSVGMIYDHICDLHE